jgi:predicted lipid-binding transport protein (Tim44 family)
MKIIKWSWFFHLLGLLALVMTFGVMFAGCDASTITIGGGLLLGGMIGSALDHVIIGVIVGGVIGFIVFLIITPRSSSSGTSFDPKAYTESRKNDPHTCGNCTRYSSARGECRNNGNPMSAGDSCSNWC